MPYDLAYTFPVGGERFSTKACYLAKSIHEFCDSPEIYTYILPRERETVPEHEQEFLAGHTTLIEGERPIEDYPISAKLAAFQEGAKASNRPYIVHLDSDTLVLNDLQIHQKSDADVFLRPADLGFNYWGQEESYPRWEQLYEQLDVDFPGRTLRSTVDDKPIPPFYNAGAVVAKNGSFPSEWLEMTEFVHQMFPDQRYSDQVSLGLLSHKYRIEQMDEKTSLIMGGHYWCPSSVNVLRYQDFCQLIRNNNPRIWKKLYRIGLTPKEMARHEDQLIRGALERVFRAVTFRSKLMRRTVQTMPNPFP